ncbi:MAG: nuclear transport factor 2 family protein [Nostoc sp. NMS8]|nr:nuclear transport factor 2 family protein [Nostoc sp. NMS8]
MATNNEQAIRHLYHVAEAEYEDLKAFVACFTADGEFVDMASGITFRGSDELWKPVAVMSKAFPDMHREIHHLHVVGDIVIVELTLQGTHTGPLTLPIGTIPASGKTMDAPCCDVFRLINGKVRLFDCYNQSSVILAQLGVLSNLQGALVP